MNMTKEDTRRLRFQTSSKEGARDLSLSVSLPLFCVKVGYSPTN